MTKKKIQAKTTAEGSQLTALGLASVLKKMTNTGLYESLYKKFKQHGISTISTY